MRRKWKVAGLSRRATNIGFKWQTRRVTTDDWRIQGQAKYLQGASLIWRPWSTDNPQWDHDHCDFCFVHFGDHVFEDDPNTQLEGWTDQDGNHWVCQSCFEDFRTRFDWKVDGPTS